MIERHPLWWLSFASPHLPKGEQFLGAAIVRGANIADVASKAYLLGCNPGGEVSGLEIPEEAEPLFPASYVDRLLTREEAEGLDRIITPGLTKLSEQLATGLASLGFVIEPDGDGYRLRLVSEEKPKPPSDGPCVYCNNPGRLTRLLATGKHPPQELVLCAACGGRNRAGVSELVRGTEEK